MIERTETEILNQIKKVENRLSQLFNIKNPSKLDKAEERSLTFRLNELKHEHYAYCGNHYN